jgi:glucokinase
MRAINASRVIRELRAGGPMSRASLVRATGLSKPTMTNLVSYLESEGHIEPIDAPNGLAIVGTTRAQLYGYRAGRGQVLGIDLGADKILFTLADLAGTTIGTRRLTTRDIHPLDPDHIFAEIDRVTTDLIAAAGATRASLLWVVVGTPGIVSPTGIVSMAPQLPGWEGLDLQGAMSRLFRCPVSVERETALSLQAERSIGVAQQINDALFIHLGVGVGASLLVDGRIYRGAQGGAGEIGMMPLPPGSNEKSDDGFGPFESQTGGIALARQGQQLATSAAGTRLRELAGNDISSVDAAVVFAAMREGDAAAAQIVNTLIGSLAWGISSLVCALNPQTIIIAGGLSRSADLFLPELKDRVAGAVPFAPQWLVSHLGDEAVAVGAVHQATELVERNLFSRAPKRARV